MTVDATARPRWALEPGPTARPGDVPGGTPYHRLLAGPRRRIGRAVLTVVLLAVGLVGLPTGIGRLVAAVEQRRGHTVPIIGGDDYTPLVHAGSMLSLGLLIGWSMLIRRLLYRAPTATLHSVRPGFRFDVFGRALLVLGPVWLLVIAVTLLAPGAEITWDPVDVIAIFVITLLLTPLQAAGEEYAVRGLMFQAIGSATRNPRVGLVAAVVISSTLFAATHGSADPYILSWYLILWAGLAVITWRTGGIEVAIVLHAVLNTVVLASAPLLRSDLSAELADRSGATGSPIVLIPAAAIVVITAVVWWWTRSTGPLVTTAPRDRDQEPPD